VSSRLRTYPWRVAALVLAGIGVGTGPLLACPGCIEGSSPEVYRGFLWGMALMMVVPALLIAVIGGGLARARQRALEIDDERSSEA